MDYLIILVKLYISKSVINSAKAFDLSSFVKNFNVEIFIYDHIFIDGGRVMRDSYLTKILRNEGYYDIPLVA